MQQLQSSPLTQACPRRGSRFLTPSTKNGKMRMRTPGFYGPQSPSNSHWASRGCVEATPEARRAQLGSCVPLPSPGPTNLSLSLSLPNHQCPSHLFQLKIPVLTGTTASLNKQAGCQQGKL